MMSLLFYQFKLGWRSLKQAPLVTGLTLLVLSLGASLLAVNLILLHIMYADPIPEKSEQLFHVSLNTWQSEDPFNEPFHLLTYQDASQILNSAIPDQGMISYRASVYTKNSDSNSDKMHAASVRAFSGDFFAMTMAPFQWGSGWDIHLESQSTPEHVVISDRLNQLLFNGENSLGKSLTIENKSFTIIGILKPWHLKPKFYHVNDGQTYAPTEDIYLPLETALNNDFMPSSMTISLDYWSKMSETRNSNVYFLQSWVQLNDLSQKQAFQDYLDTYSAHLKEQGKHPLSINNQLNDVKAWMAINQVVDSNIQAFTLATFLFLVVCLFNATSLLLVKQTKAQFETSLRRALGVSRRQLYIESVTESFLIGSIAGIIAIFLSYLFLIVASKLLPRMAHIIEYDPSSFFISFCVTLSSSLLIAFYPVYSTYRHSIALQIK
ncbi:MAG: ABC transporter permease [Pseudomonadota bacterium]